MPRAPDIDRLLTYAKYIFCVSETTNVFDKRFVCFLFPLKYIFKNVLGFNCELAAGLQSLKHRRPVIHIFIFQVALKTSCAYSMILKRFFLARILINIAVCYQKDEF